MNINEDMRNQRKNTETQRGYTCRITNISTYNCAKVKNWVPN